MSFLANPVQDAIHLALENNIGAGVYDFVPSKETGTPSDRLPYITLGKMSSTPWDTDDIQGEQITVTITIWSAYLGGKECKEIGAAIYGLLHQSPAALTAAGVHFVDCRFVGADGPSVGSDGKLRQLDCLYLVTAQQE